MAAGSTPKIFLSHSNQDRDLVLRVAADLVATRASVWFARWELSAGDSIVERINDGLADSSHLLVFLSPAAIVSSWVKRELSAGLMRELSDKAVTVVCALAPGCRDEDVPPLLRDKIWLDFREDYVTGVADLLELFRHKRKSSDLLFQRGTELLSQDKPDKAIPLFRRSIKQYRANYDAMYNLGAALQRTGDEVAALELFERVSNARPQHALYRATLGRQLVSSGQMDRGLNCLREAARADAADLQSADVFLTVALGLQAAEAHEEAVASFESYLTLNPGNSQVRYLFARSLRESGALERAVAQYRLLMAEEGGRPAVLIDFAATLVRVNDPATNLEAVELYERAAAIAPHRAEPHEFLAHFYFDRGRITDSLAQLRATISIEPENLTAQYNLASVLRHLGRRQDAIAEYYRALEIAPGFERAREELRELLIASSTPPAETAVLPLLRVRIDPTPGESGASEVESDEAWPRRVAGAPNLALNYDLVQSAYVGVSASDWDTSMAEVQRLDRYVELVKRLKAADETEGPPDRDDEQALQAAIHELDDFVTVNRGADVRRT